MARVLVVEDEQQMRRMIGRVLAAAGHRVLEAENGEKALSLLAAGIPDLVITDLFMPEKEGIETIRAIRQNHPDLPIIAMTGGGYHGNLQLLSVAEKFGANARLAKPFRSDELLAVVAKVLSN